MKEGQQKEEAVILEEGQHRIQKTRKRRMLKMQKNQRNDYPIADGAILFGFSWVQDFSYLSSSGTLFKLWFPVFYGQWLRSYREGDTIFCFAFWNWNVTPFMWDVGYFSYILNSVCWNAFSFNWDYMMITLYAFAFTEWSFLLGAICILHSSLSPLLCYYKYYA